MKHSVSVLLFICAFALTSVRAQDSVELEGATVIGNRELPKVLYIVPWKKSHPHDLSPVTGLVEEALGPVDRDVFRREVEYYNAIKAGSTANSAKE